jgi:hypothetical protein
VNAVVVKPHVLDQLRVLCDNLRTVAAAAYEAAVGSEEMIVSMIALRKVFSGRRF